jgi:alpha-aminoadipate carrier protein LysW
MLYLYTAVDSKAVSRQTAPARSNFSMPYAACPGCDQNIFLRRNPKLGDIVYCDNCEADLEVVNINPIELDWPWEEDETEDEFDEEDDEEWDDDL